MFPHFYLYCKLGFFVLFGLVVSEMASARQKQKDPKDQSCVNKGLQVTW